MISTLSLRFKVVRILSGSTDQKKLTSVISQSSQCSSSDITINVFIIYSRRVHSILGSGIIIRKILTEVYIFGKVLARTSKKNQNHYSPLYDECLGRFRECFVWLLRGFLSFHFPSHTTAKSFPVGCEGGSRCL